MSELPQSFKSRVYYAAKGGLAITFCQLLSDKSEDEVKQLLNEVSFYVFT